MKLYVMRHGPAEDDSPSGDAARVLTASGRERVRHVADFLAAHDEAPKQIVTSPLVRALQTAEIVHARVKPGREVEVDRAFAPRGDAQSFVRDAAREGRKRLMVVGHEPDLSILVATLLGEPLPLAMQKAMVVGLRIDPTGVETKLRFVLDPKILRFVEDRRGG
jgi:phosphohistidine phosphatase